MNKKFYLTTAIPYVNAAPHIGHALEFVQADCVRRYHQLLGENTLLLSGGDENALKNVQAAEEAGTPIQEFVDKNSQLFADLAKKLNVEFDIFQKGSNRQHHESSQELWKRCFKNGDVYEQTYSGLYCVGCEAFYDPGELNEKGECFEHPGKKLEVVSEKNWFFKLKKYEEQIKEKIKNDELEIIPEKRRHEILSFLELGLKDISISRSNERAKNWGVPVPEDPSQRIYVWFDALNIYQSGIGFGWDEEKYQKWWPADLHIIGKGILRFHAVYWPAFLLSAGLPLPKRLFVHGYVTVNGQKISKSLGNIIDPFGLVKKYGSASSPQVGTDAVRYYLLREIPSYGDGDFSERRFKEIYNADLANGLGNLVKRIEGLVEQKNLDLGKLKHDRPNRILEEIGPLLEQFQFDKALEYIWRTLSGVDKYIDRERPWRATASKAKKILGDIIVGSEAVTSILEIAESLKPFLPETAEKIQKQFARPQIKSGPPLFPRLN